MLLDTCALLWLASGDKKLSARARKQINEAPVLCISAISGFEIAVKVGTGKLKLPDSPAKWFNDVVRHHGISVLPLDLAACIESTRLPPIHEDPCDRFIIATAKLQNLPVVTADERFEHYGIVVIQ